MMNQVILVERTPSDVKDNNATFLSSRKNEEEEKWKEGNYGN